MKLAILLLFLAAGSPVLALDTSAKTCTDPLSIKRGEDFTFLSIGATDLITDDIISADLTELYIVFFDEQGNESDLIEVDYAAGRINLVPNSENALLRERCDYVDKPQKSFGAAELWVKTAADTPEGTFSIALGPDGYKGGATLKVVDALPPPPPPATDDPSDPPDDTTPPEQTDDTSSGNGSNSGTTDPTSDGTDSTPSGNGGSSDGSGTDGTGASPCGSQPSCLLVEDEGCSFALGTTKQRSISPAMLLCCLLLLGKISRKLRRRR